MRHFYKKLSCLLFIAVCLGPGAAAYTTLYNSITYYSPSPYNLNVYYFKPADVPLDAAYRKRVSAMLLWLQNYYKQQMQSNGYGAKTFGLYTAQTQPDSIRVVLINGAHNIDFYRSTNPGGNDSLRNEVDNFISNNASLQVSAHSLVLIATPGVAAMQNLPYYGVGKMCYATDYPQLDMQYLGQAGPLAASFVTYFGGIAHELGHALNLPHSHQTLSENASPVKGTNLMADGNYTLTASPTFINRAGCAILNNCQLFSAVPNTGFYNGHHAGLTSLHAVYSNGSLTLSGRFVSDRPVKDINFYQDPYATPSAGYARVAFSVAPLGALQDSFRVVMPVSEVLLNATDYPSTGPYNLAIELVLANGETSEERYYYQYTNSVPGTGFSFDDNNCGPIPAGWTLKDIGATFHAGQACYNPAAASVTMRSWGDGLTAGSGVSDNATFLYTTITAVDTIVARVTSVTDEWNYEGGIMIRNTLDSGSAFAVISALDSRGVFWNWRATPGGASSYNIATATALPVWLRLTRAGSTITGWYSSNGTAWTLYHSQTLPLNSTVYAGAVASRAGIRTVIDKIRVGGKALGVEDVAAGAAAALSVFPNPATTALGLTFTSDLPGHAVISLNDLSGRTMLRREAACVPGTNATQLPAGDLPRGMYILHVAVPGRAEQSQKVILR